MGKIVTILMLLTAAPALADSTDALSPWLAINEDQPEEPNLRSEARMFFDKWFEKKDPLEQIRDWVNWFYKLDLNTVKRLYEIEYLYDEIERVERMIVRVQRKPLSKEQLEELKTLTIKLDSRKDMVGATLDRIIEDQNRSEARLYRSA